MSQENVEIVRRGYEAFARGGVEALMPFFTRDVVFHPFPEWVEENEYRGHAGVRAVTSVWTDNFDDFEFEVSELREVGDKVVMLGATVGRIQGSGVPIRQPLGAVYSDFRDGQVGEGRNFLTWQQALEAVGLSE
ncbi:MAG: nuclear transport factor 2 family protein [Solirubrobacteraceae bacterium]